MVSTKSVGFSNIFPDIAQSQAALAQRQAFIDEMNKQALTPIDVSKYAPGVKISPMQGLAQLGEALISRSEQNDINKKNLALAQQMNERMWGTPAWKNPDGADANIATDNKGSILGNAIASMTANKGDGTPDIGAAAPAQLPWSGVNNGGGMMQQAFPGIPQKQLMLAMQMAPDELGKYLVNQHAPTDAIKTMQQGGMSQQQINQAISGKALNDATGSYRPGMLIRNPDGSQQISPDINTGLAANIDASGNMQEFPIPGAMQAKAGIEGATQYAKQANTVIPGVTVNGREGVPILAGTGQPMSNGATTNPALAGVPVQQVSGDYSQGRPHGGWSTVDGNGDNMKAPTVYGQSAAEKSQGTAQGTNAAEANQGYQKQKAAIDSINASLDRLEQVNKAAPSGNFGIAEGKAALSNTFSPMAEMHPDSAIAAQTYNQLMNQNILGGIKSLQGLGRLDLPEINKVVETYGVGMHNSPEVRAEGIKNLRAMINNNLASSQNAVAGLNTPQVPQVSPAQAQPYQGTQPSSQPPASTPPIAAINMLKQNPALAAHFDAKYGQGASARYMGQ